MNHTLILNKNWIPVNVTSVKRALMLMYRESASALCTSTYETYSIDCWIDRSIDRAEKLPIYKFFKTTRSPIERPEIVILATYNGVPFTEINFTRHNLYKRDNYSCQYCGTLSTVKELTIDHIKPRSLGGRNSWQNCVTSCLACNTKKANTLLHNSGMKLIKEPRVPKWQPIVGLIPRSYPDSWDKFVKYKI